MQPELTLTDPTLPELPVSPEFSDTAEPVDVASPVSPESALPDPASVTFPEPDTAFPLLPPAVPLTAVELPEAPDVEVVVGSEVADPVPPEVETPAAPEEDEADGGSPTSLTLCGLAVEDPESPEVLPEELVLPAAPVPPVVPDLVVDPVVVLPLVAEDEEVEVVDTAPVVPALPELPEVAVGFAVALPLEVEPVFPVLPVVAVTLTVQDPP